MIFEYIILAVEFRLGLEFFMSFKSETKVNKIRAVKQPLGTKANLYFQGHRINALKSAYLAKLTTGNKIWPSRSKVRALIKFEVSEKKLISVKITE